MQEIKIVRLNTGEDVVAIVHQETEGVNLVEPMVIEFHSRGQQTSMVMSHWLPIQLTDDNQVFVNSTCVVCIMEPNEEFLEYYIKSLKKLKQLKNVENSVEGISGDEVSDILNAEEDLKSGVHVIH